MLYKEGRGVEKDLARATEFFRKAAANHCEKAQINLSMLYAKGEGVERDLDKAADLLIWPAEFGDAEAKQNLVALWIAPGGDERLSRAVEKWKAEEKKNSGQDTTDEKGGGGRPATPQWNAEEKGTADEEGGGVRPAASHDDAALRAAWARIAKEVLPDIRVEFSALSEELYPAVKRLDELFTREDQDSKRFQQAGKRLILEIETYVYGVVYERLVSAGVVDKDVGTCVVFVPVPAPGMKNVSIAEHFVLDTCKSLRETNAKVVVVDTPYGNPDVAPGKVTGGKRPAEYPVIFSSFISSGLVTLAHEFPGTHTTPFGFIFRNGQLLEKGNILQWAEEPEPILKLMSE